MCSTTLPSSSRATLLTSSAATWPSSSKACLTTSRTLATGSKAASSRVLGHSLHRPLALSLQVLRALLHLPVWQFSNSVEGSLVSQLKTGCYGAMWKSSPEQLDRMRMRLEKHLNKVSKLLLVTLAMQGDLPLC
mmetsp:Transcript_16236/g.35314  ORF Transcript_16236/g.35314 Transcript_16236/m.35314 type:complete len:134 (-) Transcript_16236:354-755(-)